MYLPVYAASASASATEIRHSAQGAELYALDCGRVEMADMGFLADDGSMKGKAGFSVVPCFVIQHAKGTLIWDTGLPDSTRGKIPPADASFKFSLQQSLPEKLQLIGLKPSSIQYVSFSHLHFDHAGNANLFADSTWIVDQSELTNAFSQQAKERGESVHYEKLQSAKKIVIGSNSPYDVFGDGTVMIYRAPGHTAGHSVLLVKTKHSGSVLLAGDLWIAKESQQRKLVPIYNDNREATLHSMDFVEALARKNNAVIIRQHVIEDFNSLPEFPAALK